MVDREKVFCNTCKHETNHALKSHHYRDYVETCIDVHDGQERLAFHEKWNYRFWVCLGCDTATLEEQYHCDQMQDSESREYFPLRADHTIRSPKKFLHISPKLRSIYNEVITAYQQRLNILCAIGLRALLEGICADKGINDRKKEDNSLHGKIKKLGEQNNIPQGIVDGLNHLKVFGNDAAHRLDPTTKNKISLAIDLIEALLTHLYEAKFDLEYKAKLMKGEPVPFWVFMEAEMGMMDVEVEADSLD